MSAPILRLSVGEYRAFAEIAKAHGRVLRVVDKPAILGLSGPLADCFIDATSDATVHSMTEAPEILLCTSINADSVRSMGAARFECNLARLSDAEMYRFWLFHEIGHKAHNYSMCMAQLEAFKRPEVAVALDTIAYANEILADRWAWAQVCDRPMPLSARGARDQDWIAGLLEYLDGLVGPPRNFAGRWQHVEPGQYRGIPARMLARHDAREWIGPDIHPDVLRRAAEYEVRHTANPDGLIPESVRFDPMPIPPTHLAREAA